MPVMEILLTVISSSVLLIPIFIVMFLLRFWDRKAIWAYYLFAVYLCVVYRLTGPPDITYFRWDPGITFVPFIGMIGDLRSTVLNIVLFLPLGIGLPLLWDRYDSLQKTLLFGFCISLGIETAQLFTYRATDINDLITNVTGTLLGYLIYKGFLPKRFSRKENDAPILLGICCTVMFFGEPIVHSVLYRLL